MKLSEKTFNLLKNFSSINQSILFKQGTTLRTMSVMKNILAEADIEEDFPKDFGIYDLNQFLNGIDLCGNPELDFEKDNYLKIRDGEHFETKYFFADPSVIVTPPDKTLTLPSEDVCFTLDNETFTRLLKASVIYKLPDLSAVGENGVVKLVVRDKKNDTSNKTGMVVGETDKDFSFNFKVENIKILPGSYEVVISEKLLSRFYNKNYNLTYYIALEPDSTFG
tara:strand:- start:44 stop:712 length:669 start_codon:yes stop_codon:yes gene_type:complete